jgi:hypothetical protein
MKHITTIFFLLLFTMSVYSQTVGDLSTPYSTSGWDAPAEYTSHYQLPVYTLLSNPGGWINKSQVKVDSLLNALIVLTDSLQFQIRNDVLIHSKYGSGIDSIEIGQEFKVHPLTGIDDKDILLVTQRDAVGAFIKPLSVAIDDNQFTVTMEGTSTEKVYFSWQWIRRYD